MPAQQLYLSGLPWVRTRRILAQQSSENRGVALLLDSFLQVTPRASTGEGISHRGQKKHPLSLVKSKLKNSRRGKSTITLFEHNQGIMRHSCAVPTALAWKMAPQLPLFYSAISTSPA